MRILLRIQNSQDLFLSSIKKMQELKVTTFNKRSNSQIMWPAHDV